MWEKKLEPAFLKFTDYQDSKRPFFWTELPKGVVGQHMDYFSFIAEIRNMIKIELGVKSSQSIS